MGCGNGLPRWADAMGRRDGNGPRVNAGRFRLNVTGQLGWRSMSDRTAVTHARAPRQMQPLERKYQVVPADSPGTVWAMNPLHPNKLLLSKWTAVAPVARQKHFLVSRVLLPELPGAPVEWIDIEAVHSGAVRRIAWRELRDAAVWRQGWV